MLGPQQKRAEKRGIRSRCLPNANDDLLGHHQHMHGSLRLNVVKRDPLVSLRHDPCWNLAGDDFLENAHGFRG
jgi:hypothetical protein